MWRSSVAFGGDEDELTGGVFVAAKDAAADEAGVAGEWDLEVEVEVLNGVRERLEAIVVGDDADGGDTLGGDFHFDVGPSEPGRFDGTAGETVGAFIL